MALAERSQARGVVTAEGATGGLQLNKRSTAQQLTGEALVNPPKFKGGSDRAVAQARKSSPQNVDHSLHAWVDSFIL